MFVVDGVTIPVSRRAEKFCASRKTAEKPLTIILRLAAEKLYRFNITLMLPQELIATVSALPAQNSNK